MFICGSGYAKEQNKGAQRASGTRRWRPVRLKSKRQSVELLGHEVDEADAAGVDAKSAPLSSYVGKGTERRKALLLQRRIKPAWLEGRAGPAMLIKLWRRLMRTSARFATSSWLGFSTDADSVAEYLARAAIREMRIVAA